MRFMRSFLILILLITGVYYLLEQSNMNPKEAFDKISNVVNEKKVMLKSKINPDLKRENVLLDSDVFQWINKSPEELVNSLGEPERKDLSAYGYTWWVYTDQLSEYIQFGVKDSEIQSIYATGNNIETGSVKIGQSYEDVNEQFSFKNQVTYNKGISFYTFYLKKDDLQKRPLAKISEDVFVQCYFDAVTNTLSSIRLLTGDVLLKHAPYELEYRGKLPEQPILSDEQWEKVDKGMEQQIFDITNVIRNQHNTSPLKWSEEVSEVAYVHSKDMKKNNYFSHYGLNGSGLKERLAAKELFYVSAGENIAAQYPDAPATVEGWLNSEGHREALLKEDYTHLGVGVHRLYYTQNFLSKPN